MSGLFYISQNGLPKVTLNRLAVSRQRKKSHTVIAQLFRHRPGCRPRFSHIT